MEHKPELPESHVNGNKPVYYVNVANIAFSVYDFILGVGMKKDRTPGTPPKDEDVDAIIIMSPQHAKALSNILLDTVKKYEDLYGTTISLEANPEVQAKLAKESQ